MTGRAYPLFEIAQMILQKPERHAVLFSVKKNPEGNPLQPLFVCALDDSLWLSEDEAVGHVLKRLLSTFYQAERTATEPPKGKYTFVAQCGLSGIVLGPPNHHDYQNQLRKLHAERFSRMPFDVYKSKVRIVRDEDVVKKWIDEQSWRTEYVCLNQPEPLRLSSLEAVEKHFRETHKESIIKQVEAHTLSGVAARGLRCGELARLVRSTVEDQKRFPLPIATTLSQRFAAHGLQFFKVNKTVTHVSVARPHYLDLAATPVSDGIKRIVEYINANPKCTRRQLVEGLAPTPTPAPVSLSSDPAGAVAAVPPESLAPTPAQAELIADLHWLVHQGHVIEFANGTLDTAKKPVPKPPKPAPKEAASKAIEPAQEGDPGAAPSGACSIDTPVGATEVTLDPSPAAQAVSVSPTAESVETEPRPPGPVESSGVGETEPAPASGPAQAGS
jgi:hypothetical protein